MTTLVNLNVDDAGLRRVRAGALAAGAAAIGLAIVGWIAAAVIVALVGLLLWAVVTGGRLRRQLVDELTALGAGTRSPEELGTGRSGLIRPVFDVVRPMLDGGAATQELVDALEQERAKTLEMEILANRLEETRRQLEASNEELSSFTYSAGHDLAAPLRVIEGLSGILVEDHMESLDEDGQAHLTAIHQSSGRLVALVRDLLVLSRMKEPDPADVESIFVADLVNDLVADIRNELPAAAKVVVRGDLPELETSPGRIRLVLQNLISNGCKFNRSDEPTITIDGWTEGGVGIVRVTDNGIGIPENEEATVFGLFSRGASGSSFEGTGAGLAIAKRATQSVGGELWIERSSPAGTTFVLAVPVERGTGTAGLGTPDRSARFLTF